MSSARAVQLGQGPGARQGIHLLEVVPDLVAFLSDEERVEAEHILLPAQRLARGLVDVKARLEAADAFGAVIVRGMLLERLQVSDQVGLRLLGPGDLVSLTLQPRSMLLSYAECRVVEEARVALLGREMLVAVHRWPRLLAGLHVRLAEQSERVAAQLVICQLPRVEQRLLALMWLLAESWGHVTPAGTSLPLSLTHEALGGMVGARRPTVTLALRELSDRGAVIRQERGWLLLETPSIPSEEPCKIAEPHVFEGGASVWRSTTVADDAPPAIRNELLDTVRRLREQHVRNQERLRVQFDRLARTHARNAELRRARREGAQASLGTIISTAPETAPSLAPSGRIVTRH